MKYAQIDRETLQMQGKPRDLPLRWTTSGGASINGFNSLADSVLYEFGWVPVIHSELPSSETHKYSLVPIFDEQKHCFIFHAEPRDLDLLKAEAVMAIDAGVSDAFSRYVIGGKGQEMRYILKKDQAAAFKFAFDNREDPKEADYPFVAMCGQGLTPIDRAEFILAEHKKIISPCARMEAEQETGKNSVEVATTHEAVLAVRDAVLTALAAI